MSEWLLETRELHTYYGASHVLHGVDFRIDRGETVGLMGRNGMGKSTLIRSMLGLVKPRHGEVWVCGTPMTGAEPYVVARQRSEEHTSELQSQPNIVCRLLL